MSASRRLKKLERVAGVTELSSLSDEELARRIEDAEARLRGALSHLPGEQVERIIKACRQGPGAVRNLCDDDLRELADQPP